MQHQTVSVQFVENESIYRLNRVLDFGKIIQFTNTKFLSLNSQINNSDGKNVCVCSERRRERIDYLLFEVFKG